MQGYDITKFKSVIVDDSIDLERIISMVEDPECLIEWTFTQDSDQAVPDWDAAKQQNWLMPNKYKEMDIAEYVIGLCNTSAELQRVAQELLMFQDRNLFNLLKYLVYLVDVMKENKIIWGVGRGSSVASYVLYLIGVHKINSMFYDLDPGEFLR